MVKIVVGKASYPQLPAMAFDEDNYAEVRLEELLSTLLNNGWSIVAANAVYVPPQFGFGSTVSSAETIHFVYLHKED